MNNTEVINVIPETESMTKVKESLKSNENQTLELTITDYIQKEKTFMVPF